MVVEDLCQMNFKHGVVILVYIYCDILWVCLYVDVCNVWQERPGECVGVGVGGGGVEAKKDKWQASIMIKQDYIKLKMSGITVCSNRDLLLSVTSVRYLSSLSSFKSRLKIHLFYSVH